MQICAVLAGKVPAGAEGGAGRRGLWEGTVTTYSWSGALQDRLPRSSGYLSGEGTNPTPLKLKMHKLVPLLAVHPEAAPAREHWRHRIPVRAKNWELINLHLHNNERAECGGFIKWNAICCTSKE